MAREKSVSWRLTAGAGVGASCAGAAAGAPPSGALASVSISRNWPPTSTVSPSSAKYLVMTPACDDKISTVTLSVSIRATTSSASTNSPTSAQTMKVMLVKKCLLADR